jgi:hypothetical protein
VSVTFVDPVSWSASEASTTARRHRNRSPRARSPALKPGHQQHLRPPTCGTSRPDGRPNLSVGNRTETTIPGNTTMLSSGRTGSFTLAVGPVGELLHGRARPHRVVDLRGGFCVRGLVLAGAGAAAADGGIVADVLAPRSTADASVTPVCGNLGILGP